MGAMQNNDRGGGKGSKGRGKTRNMDRLAVFSKGSPSDGADWGGCDPARVQAVVVAITALGGACTFGLSRDMGAHSLTLMLDGERQTMWFNGGADLDEELGTVLGTLQALD